MTLEQVHALAATALEQVSDCFLPGVKGTILIRTPGYPERDFIVTDDELDELIHMIKRRRRVYDAQGS